MCWLILLRLLGVILVGGESDTSVESAISSSSLFVFMSCMRSATSICWMAEFVQKPYFAILALKSLMLLRFSILRICGGRGASSSVNKFK